MPACKDCRWFVPSVTLPFCALSISDEIVSLAHTYGTDKGRSNATIDLRMELSARFTKRAMSKSCASGIFLKHADQIKGHVLEIGCGIWQLPRKTLIDNGCSWQCLDARREGWAITNGKVSDMPFDDGVFDWVCSFASVEHWAEFGDSVRDGVDEIHRVLKPSGRFLLHAPMSLHGSNMFYFADKGALLNEFSESKWNLLHVEDWRKDYEPLPVLRFWNQDRRRNRLVSRLGEDAVSWDVEILAEKI